MKTVNVSELSGVALDWAVGVSLGHKVQHSNNVGGLSISEPYSKHDRCVWSPSTDWSQGGPLIEKYCMLVDVEVAVDDETEAKAVMPDGSHWTCFGPTPLIAICRAIVGVHAKQGAVEVPEELL